MTRQNIENALKKYEERLDEVNNIIQDFKNVKEEPKEEPLSIAQSLSRELKAYLKCLLCNKFQKLYDEYLKRTIKLFEDDPEVPSENFFKY
ncbi:hypothetical protein RLOatenuis_3010 [Rickettsiales bacterium]|nr:hypothetical protein RLOatenuis_3010 [Rickettsiales bacterium]